MRFDIAQRIKARLSRPEPKIQSAVKTEVIPVPAKLDAFMAMRFSIQLQSAPDAQKYVFDFRGGQHAEPFAMLLIAQSLRQFRTAHPESNLEVINHDNLGFAAHMGFFQAAGFPIGNQPGEARGSKKYIPVTFLPIAELQEEAKQKTAHVGEIVENYAKRQAALLMQGEDGYLHEVLSYSIREIVRNTAEHSGSTYVGICGVCWSSRNEAEIAIVDDGVGVKNTLSRNKRLNIANDKDALKSAILPGITGNVQQVTYEGDPWANQGYGLYMTSRICQEGGDFMICSGSSALRMNSQKRSYPDCQTAGTAVRLFIKLDKIKSARDLLGKFSQEGSQMAQAFGKGAVINPDNASIMLDTYLRQQRTPRE